MCVRRNSIAYLTALVLVEAVGRVNVVPAVACQDGAVHLGVEVAQALDVFVATCGIVEGVVGLGSVHVKTGDHPFRMNPHFLATLLPYYPPFPLFLAADVVLTPLLGQNLVALAPLPGQNFVVLTPLPGQNLVVLTPLLGQNSVVLALGGGHRFVAT